MLLVQFLYILYNILKFLYVLTSEEVSPIGLTEEVRVAPSSVPVHPVQHPEVLVIPEQHSEVPVRPERPIPLYFGFLYNSMD